MVRFITKYSDKIQLQGVGYVSARPAKEIKVGDTLTWNYGSQSVVTEIVKETDKFIVIKEKYFENNTEYERRLKKDRLVALNIKLN